MSTLRFGALFTTEYESTQNVVIADTVGLSDQSNKDTVVVISDSIGVSDYDAQGINTGALVSQVHVQAESQLDPLVAVSHVHVQSETQETPLIAVSHAHVQIEITVALSAPVGDSVGVTDAVVPTETSEATDHETYISDAVGVTDSADRETETARPVSDAVGLSDSALSTTDYARDVADDVGVADEATARKVSVVSVSDDVGLSDSAQRTQQYVRPVSDGVDISDDAQSTAEETDADILVSDAVVATLSGDQDRSIADSIGITDTVQRLSDYVRPASDDVGISDSARRSAGHLREVADDVGITDSVLPTSGLLVERTVGDDVGLSDSAQPTEIAGEAEEAFPADTVGLTDAVSSIKSVQRPVGDDVGIADEASILEGELFERQVAEDVGVTDYESHGAVTWLRLLADDIGVSDQADRTMDYVRIQGDLATKSTWSPTDSVKRKTSGFDILADNIGVSDAAICGYRHFISISEPIGLYDSGPGVPGGDPGVVSPISIPAMELLQ